MAGKTICSFMSKHHDNLYVFLRVVAGLMFAQHGAQKLFGLLGGVDGAGGAVTLMSLMGLAGVIEFFGGLAIALGFFTRLAATIAAAEMIVAYGMAHFPNGLWPIVNKGELALLYFVVFLFITTHGALKLSLEKALLKKETF